MGSKKDGEWNYDAQVTANQTNEKIAQENLEYQREALAQQASWNDYQKSLNEKIMQREDTAIQRQVSDARAAGISPLAASQVGQATTGSAMATTNAQSQVLNNGYEAKPASKAGDFATKIQALTQLSNAVGSMAQTIDSMQNSSLNRANMQLQNQYLQSTMDDRVKSANYDTLTKYNYLYDTAKERDYNERYGLTRNMSERERLIRMGLSALFGDEAMVSKTVGTLAANGIGDTVTFSNPRQVSRQDLIQFFGSNSPASSAFQKLFDTQGNVADEMSKTVNSVVNSLFGDKANKQFKKNLDDVIYNPKKKNTTTGANRYQGNKKARTDGLQTGGR